LATLAYTENYIKPLIFVLLSLYGVAQYIVFPILVAVVGNWFSKSKRGLVCAAYGTSGNVGNIIGF
jgi:sugar phosphate permease